MASRGFEELVRATWFDALRSRQALHGEVLSVEVARAPIVIDGARIVPFSHASGIHRPRQLGAALGITTSPPKAASPPPYDDRFDSDGLFRYHYRTPSTPTARARSQADADNEAVREAQRHSLPLVYWFGVVPGRYRPFYPVYVVDDDPRAQEFSVDLTELGARHLDDIATDDPSRQYRARIVQSRMHQARFREEVLRAYRSCCAICGLRQIELVEAAHIVADSDGGKPVVTNGLGLCKLHHAAFDRHIVGIRPDLRVVVRNDVLSQSDGPMLRHGLQEFHGQTLRSIPARPAQRPGEGNLEQRWNLFRSAG